VANWLGTVAGGVVIHYLVWVAIVLGLLVLLADGRNLIPREAFRSERAASMTPMLVSAALLVAATVVIASRTYEDCSHELAFGAAGMVFGFWFKK
jgi:hypothetical protein